MWVQCWVDPDRKRTTFWLQLPAHNSANTPVNTVRLARNQQSRQAEQRAAVLRLPSLLEASYEPKTCFKTSSSSSHIHFLNFETHLYIQLKNIQEIRNATRYRTSIHCRFACSFSKAKRMTTTTWNPQDWRIWIIRNKYRSIFVPG